MEPTTAPIKAKGESQEARIAALQAELDKELKAKAVKDGKDMVEVSIDVPAYAVIGASETGITINNVHYQYGHKYMVPRPVAASLADIMARSYDHEDQSKGEGRLVRGVMGRVPQNRRIKGF